MGHLCQTPLAVRRFTETPYNATIEFLLESVIASANALRCDVRRDDFITYELGVRTIRDAIETGLKQYA